MDIYIWLLYVAFLQIVSGQVAPFTGQNFINSGQRQLPFANTNARGLSNSQQPRGAANGVPAANQFARNAAINGNGLSNAANANIASLNLNQANLANANFAGNFAGQHFGTNMAGANFETANYANLGYTDPNFTNLANNNFINGNLARVDSGNQMYSSSSASPITHTNIGQAENVACSYVTPNAVNSNYANFNNANGFGGLTDIDYGNGNIASAINNLANGINPNVVTFKIGDNPFQVISGSPGNNQLGLHIVADALEIGGTVSIAGKMPIYGTVTLNGNLPTDGKATVNYSCTSEPNA